MVGSKEELQGAGWLKYVLKTSLNSETPGLKEFATF